MPACFQAVWEAERGPTPLRLTLWKKQHCKKTLTEARLVTPASKKQAGAELALCSFAFISPNPLSQFGSSFSGWAGLSRLKPPWSAGTWLHATSLDGWVGKQTLSLSKSPMSPASGLRRATQLQKTFPISHICVGMSEKGSYHMGGMWRWGGQGLDIAAQCSSLLTACPASQHPSSGSRHPYIHTHTLWENSISCERSMNLWGGHPHLCSQKNLGANPRALSFISWVTLNTLYPSLSFNNLISKRCHKHPFLSGCPENWIISCLQCTSPIAWHLEDDARQRWTPPLITHDTERTRADIPFPPFPMNFSCYKETEEELLVPPGRQPWRCTMVSASVAGPARSRLGTSSKPGKSGPTPAGSRHSAGPQSPAAPQPCQPRPRLCPLVPGPICRAVFFSWRQVQMSLRCHQTRKNAAQITLPPLGPLSYPLLFLPSTLTSLQRLFPHKDKLIAPKFSPCLQKLSQDKVKISLPCR